MRRAYAYPLSISDSFRRGRGPALATLGLIALGACGDGSSNGVIRLVDRFEDDTVRNAPTKIAPPESIGSWNFSEPGDSPSTAKLGWKAGVGVSALRVEDGRLRGRSTTNFPIIWVDNKDGVDSPDLLHAVEVRLRVDKGVNLMATPMGADDLDFKQILERAEPLRQPWNFATPLAAGDEPQTVTMRFAGSTPMANFHKLLIRPTDTAGAEFAIESVRLISRKEHLRRIPSGVGWQGLAEIYRETLVSRAPESIVFDLDLQQHAWLDLHLGTVEDAPVTFSIRIAAQGDDADAGELLLERTLTTPNRWEEAPVDLSAHGGRSVSLSLTVSAQQPGALGFWGTAAVRGRDGASRQVTETASAELVPGNKTPQGVILIVADTLRRDHLQPWGYQRETSPTLSALAGRGALFLDNIAQATWTKVSVPSILTSLYPSSHRVTDMADRLPAPAVTLAEVFRDAGYATASYSSVPFSGKLTSLHQGFEELHERGSFPGDADTTYTSKSARPYVDRLSAWLGAHRDEPFFVFLHVFDPHSPFEPRRPYHATWSDPALREQHDKNVEQVKKFIKGPGANRVIPKLKELVESGVDREQLMGYFKGWYDGSILAMDAEVARLMERLRGLGLDDKTLLVFTSDHGEGFHDHGLMWHGQTVYGELTNVPLMFHGPSFLPQGLVIGETVQNIDIMPTVLELSGLAAPENIQGQSLTGLMAAARDVGGESESGLAESAANYGWRPRGAFSEKNLTEQTGGPQPLNTESFAVIHDGWKLIHNTVRIDEGPEYELFNHRKDPLDQNNLAEQRPEILERLKVKLEERLALARASPLPEADSTEGISDEELQRLRSLGYIQ